MIQPLPGRRPSGSPRALLPVAIASATVLAVTVLVWLLLTGTSSQTPAPDVVQTPPQSSSWIGVTAGSDDSLPVGTDGRGVPVPLAPTAPLPGQDDTLPQPPT